MLVQSIDTQNATDANAPVRVVVCGEVSAGKSTVLNTLLRARVLPDNIGQVQRPVVTVGHRAEPGVEAVDMAGAHQAAELNGGTKIFHDAAEVRLWTDHDHLEGLEIIEVPLTKAEELTEAQVALIGSADVMVWVTIASQAWRLTEKTIVEKLGNARPKHAILAVTRGDKLRNDRDRGRLRDRMVRETDHLFQEWVFIKGARRKLDKSAKCDKAWDEVGGVEMLAALQRMADAVRNAPEEPVNPEAEEEVNPGVVDFASYRQASAVQAAEALQEHDAPEETAEEDAAEDRSEDEPVAEQEEPAEAPEPAREGHDNRPTGSDATYPPSLAAMAEALQGVVVLALRPHDMPEEIQVTFGVQEQARALGRFCAGLQENLGNTFAVLEGDSRIAAFNLSTQGRRILFEDIPGVGLLYLMADASVMSQGIAQSVFSRICRKLEAEA